MRRAEKRAKFAVDTSVAVKKSRDEIESILTKFGAKSFGYGSQSGSSGDAVKAVVMFEFNERHIRFVLPLGREATVEKTERRHREKWRALFLSIKAKLVAVDTGIETFEEAFLAHVVLADGQSVMDAVREGINQQYLTGVSVPLLGGPRHG